VLPASRWRELLEEQWQARLLRVTELSLAYYETGEHVSPEAEAGAARELGRLQQQTVTARRALAESKIGAWLGRRQHPA
jgi:hypothetical protein